MPIIKRAAIGQLTPPLNSAGNAAHVFYPVVRAHEARLRDAHLRKEDEMTLSPGSNPRRDHTLVRENGRRVAWCEWGDPRGPAALLVHRNPGSRLLDPNPAATASVCLITLDRPGYGRTDPVDDPTFAAVAADVGAVADELHLDDVAVIGWSGGGMFALETAASLNGRLRSLSLLCTPAPDDEIPWMPDDFRPLVASIAADPSAALVPVTAACSFYADNPESMVASDPSEADAEVRAAPAVSDALAAMMREGARQGAIGMASDIVAGCRGDRPSLDKLSIPVHLWYGEADWIGPEHGHWYADRIQGSQLNVVAGAGHLLPLVGWNAILTRATTT
jgi:pimeloyl-ACP methyl ester carboxylesterase